MTADRRGVTTFSAATVAFADVVDFTSMTALDELGTHRVWSSFLQDCLTPQVVANNGQLIKMLGDGALVVFDEPNDAMAWAIALQGQLAEDRVGEASRWPSLRLRIGLHHGEIHFDANDIYGANVNTAKRIQELSPPNSIAFSQDVSACLRPTPAESIADLGYVNLKGGLAPIHAFAILPDGVEIAANRAAVEIPALAVLPFEQIGGTEEDRYFADGFVADIITSLSSLHELKIIARSSTLAFRDQQLDPKEAMQRLGARYILQGTLRRRGNSIRVSTTLIDCLDSVSLFSTARDLRESDIHEEHDRLVQDIVRELAPQIQRHEARRSRRKSTNVFSAYDHVLHAMHHMQRLRRSGYEAARAHLNAAVDADPDYAVPYAMTCEWYTMMVGQGWMAGRADAAKLAEDAAKKALERDNNNVLALCYYGHAKAFLMEDFDTALMLHERSRKLSPNHAPSWMLASGTFSFVGNGVEAVACAERAIDLSPIDLDLFQYHAFLAFAHFANKSPELAVFWAQRSRSENAEYTSNLKLLTAALAACDRIQEAHAVAQALLKLQPDYRVSDYSGTQRPFRDPELREMIVDNLRRAGIPN